MTTITLIGAGGKMGCRITDNLKDTEYKVFYVEVGEQGKLNLASRGLAATEMKVAVGQSDVVIMAVPDVRIGVISATIVPEMQSGAMMILLDPAAAYLGKLPEREDITYFVSHPCHPPVFNDETTMEAKKDFFGGVLAKQAIVCALKQGPDEDYLKGEDVAKIMYSPVIRSHRITVDQMAILEPTMAETVSSMVVTMLGEALDETVKRGVPLEAAKDFMLGHINIQLAIVFGAAGNPFSDACLIAIEYGKRHMIKEDWKKLFEPASIYDQVDVMLHPEKLKKPI
ncbi:semialdehyde dehydrogenase [Paenibacillus psychroresistens]|uniref:Semialdehyde dehydrogenase n=1 Tax=Paenibacillus psychroresistens TaxID=1778678 RepID=A0A6B8RES3_9BACL|nr:phosphogluconate dehydrogenase C-terminal domain-containing protein [Paenibacillus psychroresistens]QGQ94991.1 semialdehyde dehydrogenase [Paenibacillus psychroresistens]